MPVEPKHTSRGMDRLLEGVDDTVVRRRFEQWANTRRLPVLLLVLVCMMTYLPGISRIPPLDRDEPRYTQASRQMVESGDYTRMYFQDKFRNRKPIGIYWLQAASVNLFGGESVKNAIWPYRLPNVLCATGSVLLLFLLGCRLMAPAPALMSALLLAVTPLQMAVSRFATTDSALLFATLLAQYNLIAIYLANRQGGKPRWRNALVFWVAVGSGILIKGPITPLVALLTATGLMVLNRDGRVLKGLRPWIGVPLMLAIVLPWLISIQIATDGAFLRDSLGGDFGSKLVSGRESHGAPPGFYTLLAAVTCWPVSLLIVPALIHVWRGRRECDFSKIAFSWIIPYLILIELVPTKLPHYVLSIYPPIVLLCVRFAWNGDSQAFPAKILKGLHWIYSRLWVLAFPLAALVSLASTAVSSVPLVPIVIGLILSLAAVAFHRINRMSGLCRMAMSIPLLAATAVLLFGILLPGLGSLWISRSIADSFWMIKAGHPEARLYAAGYHEPSLVFLTETATRLVRPAQLEVEYNPGMVAFLTDKAAQETHVELEKIASIEGINYSKGARVRGGVYCHPQLLLPNR